jgi:peptide/nickel transport system permease protein
MQTKLSVPVIKNRTQNRLFRVLSDVMARPSGVIGLFLVVFHLVLAVVSPFIVPFDYREISAMLMLKGPSFEHWFGNDHLGRDIFSRTLLGGREAILVTGIATPIAVLWGSFLGIFFGLGTGIGVLIPTLAFFYGIPVIRIARAATHDVVARDFISAAKARGHGRISIIRHELLPNVLDTIMVEGAMRWSWMLLAFSSLSFLGFGASPPTPDWGLMIADARGFMSFAPWGVLAPVVFLSSLIIGINLTADALAKALGIDRIQKAPV